jgi:hypothetical protein
MRKIKPGEIIGELVAETCLRAARRRTLGCAI